MVAGIPRTQLMIARDLRGSGRKPEDGTAMAADALAGRSERRRR
jgi:hypothetical protein